MTQIAYDRMAVSTIVDASGMTGPVTNAPNGPFASGSTPQYFGQILDQEGAGIPAADLSLLTLSIVDTLTGAVINGVSQTNILNTGRGTVDASGNLVISLLAGDTTMDEVPGAASVQRSLVIDWAYTKGSESGSGRKQVNFTVVSLAGA